MSSAAILTDDLTRIGFGDWQVTPIRGDASSRRFARLTNASGASAILMQTPQDQLASQAAFLTIAALLSDHDLAAPKVLAQDPLQGIVVMQDLGTTDVATALRHAPQDEARIYTCCVDVLTRIHAIPPSSDLVTLTPQQGADMLDPVFAHFAPDLPADQVHQIKDGLATALSAHATGPMGLSLRDFHAENLIWRPDLTNMDQIGLIDFQDAFCAPAEYDLVSLLRDARRDVSQSTRAAALTHFCSVMGRELTQVTAACAVLGVQRNLRILGIFARLANQAGKPEYLRLIPRVCDHIRADLSHPANQPFATSVHAVLEHAA